MGQDRSLCRVCQFTEPGKEEKCKSAEQFRIAESEPEIHKCRHPEVQ